MLITKLHIKEGGNMPDYVGRARAFLSYLRKGTHEYDSCLAQLFSAAEKGNFQLSYIGTSEEELRELRFRNCRATAEWWLNALRHGSVDQYELSLNRMLDELEKYKDLWFEAIGTDEGEIFRIILRCQKAQRNDPVISKAS